MNRNEQSCPDNTESAKINYDSTISNPLEMWVCVEGRESRAPALRNARRVIHPIVTRRYERVGGFENFLNGP